MSLLRDRRCVASVLALVAVGTLFLAGASDATHMRPKSARPIREALVPAFKECTFPNRSHKPALSFPSCHPPEVTNKTLAIGTPDVNGLPANSVSFVKLNMLIPPAAGAPDLTIRADVKDVYCNVALPTCTNTGEALDDYVGSVGLQMRFRVTDHCNFSSAPASCTDPATVIDFTASVKVACGAVTGGPPGGRCALDTTINSLVPGTVLAGERMVWELPSLVVEDGGQDGDASTTPNEEFLVRGLFQP